MIGALFAKRMQSRANNNPLQQRLEGPADTGCAGCSHEQVSAIDGMEAAETSDEEDGEGNLNAALPDEDDGGHR